MTNMNEELDIIKKCGKENPFKVPEGYFENFTSNLMAQLQTEEATMVEAETGRTKNHSVATHQAMDILGSHVHRHDSLRTCRIGRTTDDTG